MLLQTDQRVPPKMPFTVRIKSSESTSETRDSSSCSALQRLRESKQAFTGLSFYKVKIIIRKNAREATKVSPSWRQAGRELITTFSPQLLSHLPQQKIGELRHWNKPSAPLCLCYTDCTKPQRSAKSKIFIPYNRVKDLYPSPSKKTEYI